MKGSIIACAMLTSAFAASSRPALAQSPTGRTVRGTVFDSLSNGPLAHASVSIVNRSDTTVAPRTVQSDDRGRFVFTSVPSGVYLIGFQAPLLDSLGVSSPTRVLQLASAGAGVIVNLAVPSAATIHDAFCPKRPANDSTSVFVGHLSNASTRGVVANGEIDATWLAIEGTGKKGTMGPRSARTHSGADGWFALCDLPAGVTVAMHAIAGPDTSGVVYFQMPATRGLVRHEVYLADRNAPRDGVIAGRIADANGGRPIAGARVRADANGATATSTDSGRFTITGVPYGTSDLIVRGIGFLPQRVVVDVLAGEPTTVSLSLLNSNNLLDTVRVRAARTIADDYGFSERQKAGFGHYFDLSQIERMQPFETSDIVKRVPGIRVSTNGMQSVIHTLNTMTGQYNCVPTYWLDGIQLRGVVNTQDLQFYAPPEQLAAVEVYKDAAETPGEFMAAGSTGCGAIVMWSLPVRLWNQHRGGE